MKKIKLFVVIMLLFSLIFVFACNESAPADDKTEVEVGNVILSSEIEEHGEVVLSALGEQEVDTIVSIEVTPHDGYEVDYVSVNGRHLMVFSFKVVAGDNVVFVAYKETGNVTPPDTEKVLKVDATNFNKLPILVLENVVPNTSYPNEFTMTKKTGSITCSAITSITKIVAIVYSNAGTLKVFDSVNDTTPIEPSETKDNSNYSKGKEMTFNIDNKDEFKIINESSTNVYFFELNIYYTGEITGEIPFIDQDETVEVSSRSLGKSNYYTSSLVEAEDEKLSFAPNAEVVSVSLYKVLSVKMYGGSNAFSVYVVTKDGAETKLTGVSENDYIIFKAEGLFDTFKIKNETNDTIKVDKFIIDFEEEKVIHNITIQEANDIALSLPMSSGISTDFYRMTGIVILEGNGQVTIADGDDSITCFGNIPDNMHLGYSVTIVGQLENHYFKAEVVNFKLESYSKVFYDVTLNPSTNGTYTVNKEKGFEYGEQIVITAYPDEGYIAKQAKIDGRVFKFNSENVIKASITSNAEISVIFVLDTGDEPIQLGDERFVIHSLEMSGTYGDANLIQYGNYDILVDAGTDADTINLKNLLNQYVTDGILDLIIVSHPDSDHYTGIVNGSLEGVDEVKRLIVNTNHSENDRIKQAVLAKSPEAVIEVASELTSSTNLIYTIAVDELFNIDIMYVPGYDTSGKNSSSIPAMFRFKNTKLFMAGDMTASTCNEFMNTYPNLFKEEDFVIFKILHHGSNGSNKNNFLQYLKPDMAFVSAPLKTSAPNNSPNFSTHPYNEAMIRVGAFTTDVYWAGLSGNLTIECDGYNYTVQGDTRTRDYYYYNKVDGSYTKVDRTLETNISYYASYWYLQAIENLGAPDYLGIKKN